MAKICGGWSEPQEATEETQKICDQVKDQVEKITDQKHQVYKAVLYREQIVAGQNFLIKVFAGEDDYLHLFVFRALPCDGGRIELNGVEQHRTKGDPLEPFMN
ncbi:cystatin-B-like [Gasterosteus aculeatus]